MSTIIWTPPLGAYDIERAAQASPQRPASPAAAPLRSSGNPFELPAKRRVPLPADHAGVVAAGRAVAKLRRPV